MPTIAIHECYIIQKQFEGQIKKLFSRNVKPSLYYYNIKIQSEDEESRDGKTKGLAGTSIKNSQWLTEVHGELNAASV